MEDGGEKCFFHNSVYVNDCGANSHIRRCPSRAPQVLTMDDGRKKFFHNSFHVKDYGTNVHLQKFQKTYQNT
jgi:hypothetical protein